MYILIVGIVLPVCVDCRFSTISIIPTTGTYTRCTKDLNGYNIEHTWDPFYKEYVIKAPHKYGTNIKTINDFNTIVTYFIYL